MNENTLDEVMQARLLAERTFGAAWYRDSVDGRICHVGPSHSEVYGKGRTWEQAMKAAEITRNALQIRP